MRRNGCEDSCRISTGGRRDRRADRGNDGFYGVEPGLEEWKTRGKQSRAGKVGGRCRRRPRLSESYEAGEKKKTNFLAGLFSWTLHDAGQNTFARTAERFEMADNRVGSCKTNGANRENNEQTL